MLGTALFFSALGSAARHMSGTGAATEASGAPAAASEAGFCAVDGGITGGSEWVRTGAASGTATGAALRAEGDWALRGVEAALLAARADLGREGAGDEPRWRLVEAAVPPCVSVWVAGGVAVPGSAGAAVSLSLIHI